MRPAEIEKNWQSPRWNQIERPYSAEDVDRLQGSLVVEHTLARRGAERLWESLQRSEPVRALGALTGNQAVQQVRAGLDAIYLSGWQVAGDANKAGQMYPDQSLYPVDSVPEVVKRINNALARADQIQHVDQDDLRAQPRRGGRTTVPRRPASDDHHSCRHALDRSGGDPAARVTPR